MDSELFLPFIVSYSNHEQEQIYFWSSLLSSADCEVWAPGAEAAGSPGKAQQLPVRKPTHSSPQHLI